MSWDGNSQRTSQHRYSMMQGFLTWVPKPRASGSQPTTTLVGYDLGYLVTWESGFSTTLSAEQPGGVSRSREEGLDTIRVDASLVQFCLTSRRRSTCVPCMLASIGGVASTWGSKPAAATFLSCLSQYCFHSVPPPLPGRDNNLECSKGSSRLGSGSWSPRLPAIAKHPQARVARVKPDLQSLSSNQRGKHLPSTSNSSTSASWGLQVWARGYDYSSPITRGDTLDFDLDRSTPYSKRCGTCVQVLLKVPTTQGI